MPQALTSRTCFLCQALSIFITQTQTHRHKYSHATEAHTSSASCAEHLHLTRKKNWDIIQKNSLGTYVERVVRWASPSHGEKNWDIIQKKLLGTYVESVVFHHRLLHRWSPCQHHLAKRQICRTWAVSVSALIPQSTAFFFPTERVRVREREIHRRTRTCTCARAHITVARYNVPPHLHTHTHTPGSYGG
jgi:hypothetical protein